MKPFSINQSLKGRVRKSLLLLSVFLCTPFLLMAHKDDKNPKYLLGAVPEVDGVVTFQKSFSVTDKSTDQIYEILLAYVKNNLIAGAIQKQEQPYTRIISEDKAGGSIVARIEEYMTFHKAFYEIDQTRFRYLISASVTEQKVSLVITQITYYYNEDMDGKNGVHYKAEEWITDKEAVNKKGTKLYPRSGKFRRLTVDRVEAIFENAMDAIAETEVEEQTVTTKRRGIVED